MEDQTPYERRSSTKPIEEILKHIEFQAKLDAQRERLELRTKQIDFAKINKLNNLLIKDKNLKKIHFSVFDGIYNVSIVSENRLIECLVGFNVPFRRITVSIYIKKNNLCDVKAVEYLGMDDDLIDFGTSTDIALENVPAEIFNRLTNIPY
ncbi:MAG: hypothetical protein K2Q03_04200 [Sphingobacteriaceae bacterium]|nr:hypothetical protein [Sphingobacteriaceae bacterium]